nr:MAG TPA: hypothetical protein [Caudoviricetes sp.]
MLCLLRITTFDTMKDFFQLLIIANYVSISHILTT